MRLINWLPVIAATLALAIGGADMAQAKDKKGKKNGKGASHQVKPGKGPKAIPPGQIKRYTRGAKLPGDLKYDSLNDLSKWNLKPLGPGEKYIKVDNDILRISNDSKTVLEAVGIVGDLLK